jgi:phosphatidylserine/phosphatidylglycerophosphate/cardiolipin synthase-like enzyme
VKLAGAAVPVRHMETHTSTGSTGTIAHSTEAEVLKSLVGGMMHHARGFPIKGDSVEILETPSQFYNALLQGARNARSRVVIASLYIGTGTLEQELVGSPYHSSSALRLLSQNHDQSSGFCEFGISGQPILGF